jgi:putative phosphoribosyl transferase
MQVQPIFRDRADAGKLLAERIAESAQSPGSLVLALPRGGVPVAFEVARKLRAELDIFLVRKLGLPGREELAIGAIASGGVRVLNEALVQELQLSRTLIDRITAREEVELQRREELYREGRTAVPVGGRTVILVDDGLATGASMKAAAQALRLQVPMRIVVAVPVAARDTCNELRGSVDEIICAYTPSPFTSVGGWYVNFAQTSDEEVRRLLKEAREEAAVREVPHAT